MLAVLYLKSSKCPRQMRFTKKSMSRHWHLTRTPHRNPAQPDGRTHPPPSWWDIGWNKLPSSGLMSPTGDEPVPQVEEPPLHLYSTGNDTSLPSSPFTTNHICPTYPLSEDTNFKFVSSCPVGFSPLIGQEDLTPTCLTVVRWPALSVKPSSCGQGTSHELPLSWSPTRQFTALTDLYTSLMYCTSCPWRITWQTSDMVLGCLWKTNAASTYCGTE